MNSPTRDSFDLVTLAAGSPSARQRGQARAPYAGHLEHDVERVETYGPHSVAVAWLHDVIEETTVKAEQHLLDAGVPKDVVEGVGSPSKRTGEELVDAVARAAAN